MAKDNEIFELSLKELETVVKELENGDVSLDEMLSLFERGIKLTKTCTNLLEGAEQKINILIKNKDTGEMHEENFGSLGE